MYIKKSRGPRTHSWETSHRVQLLLKSLSASVKCSFMYWQGNTHSFFLVSHSFTAKNSDLHNQGNGLAQLTKQINRCIQTFEQ